MHKLRTTVLVLISALVLASIALSTAYFFAKSDAPLPVDLKSSPLSLDQYRSSFLVPVSVTASKLSLIIDEQAPKQVSGTQDINIGGNVHEERLEYTVYRGSVNARAEDDQIQISVPLYGSATAKAEYCPGGKWLGCFDVQETAELRATVNATLSNIRIGKDWIPDADLTLDVDVTKAEVRLLDLITVSFQDNVEREIRGVLPSLVPDVKQKLIGELNLQSRLEETWSRFDPVFKISEHPEVWLVFDATELGAMPVTTANNVIHTTVALSSEVSIHIGSKPDKPVSQSLPEPSAINRDVNPAFHMRVPIFTELGELQAQLNACCSPLSFSLYGDKSLTLSNLTLREQQGRLLIGADFAVSGWWAPRGVIYILATPVLDEQGDTLLFEDLNFTVESDEGLTKAAVKIAHSVIITHLQNTLKVDLTSRYGDAKNILNSAVNGLNAGHDINLTIQVGNIKLIDALIAGNGKLAVVGELTGNAIIKVY